MRDVVALSGILRGPGAKAVLGALSVVFGLGATGCAERTSDLAGPGGPPETDAGNADGGGPPVDGGGVEVDGAVDAVVMKVWQLRQPHLLRTDDREAEPIGSYRAQAYGRGQGELTYLTRLGDDLVFFFEGRDDSMRLYRLRLDGGPNAVPELLADLAAPWRFPPLTAASPDGEALAYFDAERVYVVRPGQPPRDLGRWAGEGIRRLVWTADSRYVVGASDDVNVAFGVSPPAPLTPGWLMGVGPGASVYIRTDGGRVVREALLDDGTDSEVVTPPGPRAGTFVAADAQWAVFSFVSGQSRRLGAVPAAAGPITWLSPATGDARDGFVRAGVLYYVLHTPQGATLNRVRLDGTEAQTVTSWHRGPQRLAVVGSDADTVYACDGRAAVLTASLQGQNSPWVPRAEDLAGQCRWAGQTDDDIVLRVSGREPQIFRLRKGTYTRTEAGASMVAALPEGIVSQPMTLHSQLVRVGEQVNPLTNVQMGLVVGFEGTAWQARLTDRGALIFRDDRGQWWLSDVIGGAPRSLSPPGHGGRLIAVDAPWVVLAHDASREVSVLDTRGDPRMVAADAIRPVYHPATRSVWALSDRGLVRIAVENGNQTNFFQPANPYGILASPTSSLVFVVASTGVYLAEPESLRLHASVPALGANLTLSADEQAMVAIEVTLDTAVPHPRAGWSIPTGGTVAPVIARPFVGLPQPLSMGFDPIFDGLPGRAVVTLSGADYWLEALDASADPIAVAPWDPSAPAGIMPSILYGAGWYAVRSPVGVTTIADFETGAPPPEPTDREVPPGARRLLVAAGDYGVLSVTDAGREQLWFFEGLGAGPAQALTPASLPYGARSVMGVAPIVPLPDGTGVLYASEGGGDVSLYRATFESGLAPEQRVRPLTQVDDAEEVFIGFVPRP